MESVKKRYKGRFVSQKVYEKILKQVEAGKKRKKTPNGVDDPNEEENKLIKYEESDGPVTGYRIIDYEVFKQNMRCAMCKSVLDPAKTEGERKLGLSSAFKIRCDECLFLNTVETSRTHKNPGKNGSIPDINSQVLLGALHAGLGHTQVEKLFSVCNLPVPTSKTFKRREREVGIAVEKIAKDSCRKATKLERDLTVKNLDNLSKLFPDAPENFFIPTKTEGSEITEKDTIRVMGSYDMGYSGRGTGYTYDSLNGYSALIGSQSGLVLDYVTQNRKCRMCDVGHPKDDHDCRLNFYGSAKAMESHAAVRLVTESTIFNEEKIELGVFVGDNDSSSISAVRKAADHTILKVADKNHTSKGVKNMLWKIKNSLQDPDHELTVEAINYFHKNFGYAVAQNQNNSSALAAAVSNIPHHAFNHHDNCGEWCGFVKNPKTYDHKTVPGGFQNQVLFEALKTQFNRLAANSDAYAVGASTQANESLNSTMARKCPKASCLSLSESSDFRYACSVGQKNEGDLYISQTLHHLKIKSGTQLVRFIEKNKKLVDKRRSVARTQDFKRNRRRLKKIRSQLRNRREATESETYERNMGLLAPQEPNKNNFDPLHAIAFKWTIADALNHTVGIVIFDLETSGFQMTCDLLQIAAKYGNTKFNEYIKPGKTIRPQVTEVNGLSSIGNQLYYRGRLVSSSPLVLVLEKFFKFLNDFNKPCLLVAHNCAFDAPRLIKAIRNASLVDQFRKVVIGFVDTLPLIRKKFPERNGKGQCTLTALAEDISIPISNAHDAYYDVYLLELICQHHFTIDELENSQKSFDEFLQAQLSLELSQGLLGTLNPLKSGVSLPIRRRMAGAGISYDILIRKFTQEGPEKTIELLQQKVNGKPSVIKTKKVMEIILRHLSVSTKENINSEASKCAEK